MPLQVILVGVMPADGDAFTTTETVAVLVHPAALVPVTVYEVVVAGFTVVDAVVAPVFQA